MNIRPPEQYWTIPSASELGVSYTVTLRSDGSFICDCPAFTYRGHLCKHVKKAKMLLAGEKQKNELPIEGWEKIDKEIADIKKDLGVLREVFDTYRTLCEAIADENARLKKEIEILKTPCRREETNVDRIKRIEREAVAQIEKGNEEGAIKSVNQMMDVVRGALSKEKNERNKKNELPGVKE